MNRVKGHPYILNDVIYPSEKGMVWMCEPKQAAEPTESHCIAPINKQDLISSETIVKMVQIIVSHCNPIKIILFGSYASGKPGPDSDLDLLVVMPSSLPRYKRASPIRMLFRSSPCPMDILVYTPEEVNHWMGTVNHIVTHAMQFGMVLHERWLPIAH